MSSEKSFGLTKYFLLLAFQETEKVIAKLYLEKINMITYSDLLHKADHGIPLSDSYSKFRNST